MFIRENHIVKAYDIICNILLGCFVNIYANSIMVTGLTVAAGRFFVTNSRMRSGSGVLKALLHVVFVQWYFYWL